MRIDRRHRKTRGLDARAQRWLAGAWRGVVIGAVSSTVMLSTGCHDLAPSPGLPAGTPDPALYNSVSGARGLRNAAVKYLETAIPTYVRDVGLLADELEDHSVGASTGTQLHNAGTVSDPLDERILLEGTSGGKYSYSNLQNVRGAVNLAVHALAAYDTAPADQTTQRALRGELYAFAGYAEILLADLFCSGVPLSTLDFRADYTYKPSSTTAQVYQDALTQLDSALALGTGNDSLTNLSRVLRGRAYLALGNYTAAADDVSIVPDGFQYTLAAAIGREIAAGVADREGGNGLPFQSDADPRTATVVLCVPPYSPVSGYSCNDTLFIPSKYSFVLNDPTPFDTYAVASGIEARLIQAEAQLQPATAPEGPWLATLNHLRASVGLSDTTDPGTAEGRIALLFRERAYWLFVTGHRQGDLRRLLRQYGQYSAFQSESRVYPVGIYTAPGTGRYGSNVNAPIPVDEYANPYFHGCLSRAP